VSASGFFSLPWTPGKGRTTPPTGPNGRRPARSLCANSEPSSAAPYVAITRPLRQLRPIYYSIVSCSGSRANAELLRAMLYAHPILALCVWLARSECGGLILPPC
jgi:hypothetical protein